MRAFTNNFLAQAANQSALPYLVLEIDWGSPTGVQYYLDRSPTSFVNNDGYRFPANGLGSVLVLDWGHIGVSLKEGQIGVTDQTTVTLDDAGGAITNVLNSIDQQRRQFTIWRMFDDPSVTWNTDKGRIFTGVLRPFSWTASDNRIVLNLGDLGPLLAKDVSLIATEAAFDKLPPSSKQKSIPLCCGRVQRVEALPISAPWETRIAQSTDGSNSVTVAITDDLSMLPGVVAETACEGYVGTNPVTITFHQSSGPTELCTATLEAAQPPVIALISNLQFIISEAAPNEFIFNFTPSQISPLSARQAILSADALQAPYIQASSPGTNLVISLPSHPDETGFPVVTTTKFNPGDWDWVSGKTYDTTWWQVVLQDNADGTLAYLKSNNILFNLQVTGPSPRICTWPAGTTLRPKDQTTIYAVCALPSKAVQIVEGYGTITDSAGDTRKDFVVLGQIVNSFVQNSSTTTVISDFFSINCNDPTWSAPAKLGRNITTITFTGSPREWKPELDDNRIWCTVLGLDDAGDGSGNLIDNPATVILNYLENPKLMGANSTLIDEFSFATAATALSGRSVGFAQTETRPGLDLLQEIALQCHSVLLFDQGVARMVVLSDAAAPPVFAFDTSLQNYLPDSLVIDETAVEEGTNELVVPWKASWDDVSGNRLREVRASKADSIAAFGPISRALPFYLYWRRADVETAADWWLDHWSTIWRTVKFTAYLDALVLQPGDWISVRWVDGGGRDLFGGAQPMMVVTATDRGADQLVDIEARYPKFTYAA